MQYLLSIIALEDSLRDVSCPKAILKLKFLWHLILLGLMAFYGALVHASALPNPINLPKVLSVDEAFILSVSQEAQTLTR